MAFDLSSDEWSRLQEANRTARHLRMPCCDAEVVSKTSRRGTRFFAHKRKGACTTAGETEHHLRLKQIAVYTARSFGWDAKTEVPGRSPSGEQWIADVLATKNAAKVAIEIQWSSQTLEETLLRQQRYADSGVRCLWLMRRNTRDQYWGTEALPMARVVQGENGEEYEAHLVHSYSHEQKFDMREFLQAAFSGRLRYRVPKGCLGTAVIWVGPIDCWRCKQSTNIVTRVHIDLLGAATADLRVNELAAFPAILAKVEAHIPNDLRVGTIKPRFSKTVGYAYPSNGCGYCDALIGRFFEHHSWYRDNEVGRFDICVDDELRQLFNFRGWAIYTFPQAGGET